MNTFLAVFNALPAILQSVQAVEAAIPLPKSGAQKLNLVLGAADAAWEVGQVAGQINKTNWISGIQVITDLTVAGLNAAGVFSTTGGSSAATQTATTAPVSSN
jgi:hypothetical protein